MKRIFIFLQIGAAVLLLFLQSACTPPAHPVWYTPRPLPPLASGLLNGKRILLDPGHGGLRFRRAAEAAVDRRATVFNRLAARETHSDATLSEW